MKKTLLLLLLIICASGVYAQDDCYERARHTGITLYNNGDYENAEKKFNQADACANKPSDNDVKTWIQKCQDAKVTLSLNKSQVEFASKGGESKVEVYTNAKSFTVDMPNWCYITDKTAGSFLLVSKANTGSSTRTGEVVVSAGAKKVTMKVVQYGNVKLTVDTQSKEFSNKGGKHTFMIGGNTTKWEVAAPEWISCDKKDGQTLDVTCAPNETAEPREGTIKITAGGNSISIAITQRAGDYIDVQDVVAASCDAKSYDIKVSASSNKWIVSSDVAWIQIANYDSEGITIAVAQNNNASVRSGKVKFVLDNIEKEVIVKQDAKGIIVGQKEEIKEKVKGKNFYFGFKFGGALPSFNVKSSSVLSSVMDYAHTDVATLKDYEKPSYKSNLGYFFQADVYFKLANNLYLNTGVGFEHYSVKNSFSSSSLKLNLTSTDSYSNNMNFSEKYKLNYLNIPIKVAYRYPINKNMAVSGNLGLIMGIGVSGNLIVDGNIYTRHYDDGTYDGYLNCNIDGTVNLFTGKYDIKQKYTTGSANTYYYDGNKDRPYNRFNMQLALGASYEFKFLEVGLNYNFGLINIANTEYWESGDRVCGFLFVGYDDYHSTAKISNYKQTIGVFEFFIGVKF